MTAEVMEGRFKAVMLAAADLLKPLGFKKRGKTFRRAAHGNVELIEFQRSLTNTDNSLKFTVNIGIVSSRLAQDRELDLSKAGSADAHLRQRIGSFLPIPHDRWWDLAGNGSEDLTISEILPLLTERVVPYLHEHSSDAALIQLWETGQSPGLTARLCERYLSTLKLAA